MVSRYILYIKRLIHYLIIATLKIQTVIESFLKAYFIIWISDNTVLRLV